MEDPLVSICCLTYNHESYVRQCLDGFLTQKTNFNFEVLIHDDASIDKTAEIISEYEAKYPDIIKPIYQKENQYSKGVGVTHVFQFPRAKGKYIAMCEGDDFWIDAYKLQKQVNFMEINSDFILSFHRVKYLNQKKNKYEVINLNKFQETFDFFDILENNFINTPSSLFRKCYLSKLSESPSYSVIGDWRLWIYLAQFGKIGYLNDVMAVYRIHDKGIHSNKNNYYYNSAAIKVFENLLNSNLIINKYCARVNTKLYSLYIKNLTHSIRKLKIKDFKATWHNIVRLKKDKHYSSLKIFIALFNNCLNLIYHKIFSLIFLSK